MSSGGGRALGKGRARLGSGPFRSALALALLLLASLIAAAPVQAAKPDQTPAPGTQVAAERVEAVIGAARAYLGVPYRVGWEGPNLFDCSGLVFRAFSDAGQAGLIGGARVRAAGYQRWFAALGRLSTVEEDAQRGDLVMYDNGAHIGLYLGEGQVLSALTSGVAVHSLRGINQAVTGFLKVDWSGDGAGPITSPGTLPEIPESPASLVPAVPWIPALDAAAAIGQPGEERVDMRTATSRTFQDADGSFTTELFTRPIFFQPPDATDWQPIDLRFTTQDEGHPVTVTASPVALSLGPSRHADGFLRLTAGDRSLSLGLAQQRGRAGADPVISLDGRSTDYFDLLGQGVGLRVVARADGFQAFLVLSREPRADSFSFMLDAPGLTPSLELDGSIALRDEAGAPVGRIPRPFLLDSSDSDGSGGGVYTSAATVGLGTTGDQQLVTINVGRRYLDEAVYPAYINMALVDFPAPVGGAELTFASSRHPNASFDSYLRPEAPGFADLWHGRQPGSRQQSEAYLRFQEIAATLGAVDVSAASLDLFPYWQVDEETTTTAPRRVIEPWAAADLTWNGRPAVDGEAELGTIQTETDAWASFDMTAYVAEILAGAADYGLALGVDAGRDSWKRFVAGGGDDPLAVSPRLTVRWSGLRPIGTPAPAVPTSSLRLGWSHAALAPQQARFEVQVSNDDFATTVVESGVVKRRAGTATEWMMPADALAEGGRYAWRVRVKYGEDRAWSTWSAPQAFTYGSPKVQGNLL